MLLNRDVGEMHVHVLELLDARIVLGSAEATEAQLVHVDLERAEGGDKDIETEVKLPASDEKRVLNVLGDNVGVLDH